MTFLQKLTRFSISSRSAVIVTIEVLCGLLICLLSLLVFLLFTKEILEKDSTLIDQQISMFVYTLRTPLLTSIMLVITAFGNQLLQVFVGLLAIIFAIRQHKKEAILFCIAIAMGAILTMSFKSMVQRPRPQMSPLIIERSYSFPSGHAMNSFIFYALVSYFSYHFFRNKKLTIWVSVICGILVLLIGFSRIYLGVHYFTDIIAGYIAGFWWFITILLIEHTMVFYRLFKKSE